MANIGINGKLLGRLLEEKGTTRREASRKIGEMIGRGENYLTQGIVYNSINVAATKAIDQVYGIPPEAYLAEDERKPRAEPAEEMQTVSAELTIDDGGREVIREAILDALVQALADEGMRKALGDVIYQSVKGAIINTDRLLKNLGGCNR